jgi:hypothetical protein
MSSISISAFDMDGTVKVISAEDLNGLMTLFSWNVYLYCSAKLITREYFLLLLVITCVALIMQLVIINSRKGLKIRALGGGK